MVRLSDAARWRIWATFEQLGSITSTAHALGHCPKVVQRWVERFRDTGNMQDLPRSGRPHVLSATACRKALDMLLEDRGGAATVAQRLTRAGVTSTTISKDTVIRAARREAAHHGLPRLRALRGAPKKALSARSRGLRLRFSVVEKGRWWRSVMFTDRKRFHFRFPGTTMHPVTWVVGGSRRAVLAPNHPNCVNVYAGITPYGMTKLHVVAGTTGYKTEHQNQKGLPAKNITRSQYAEVLADTLLPEGQRMFERHIKEWTLQQDNDPAHRNAGAVAAAYNSEHHTRVQLLPGWPPNSPDLNLIENVWGYLDARMAAAACPTFTAFKARLEKEASELPKHLITNLYASMSRRLQECRKCQGDKLGY